MIILRRKIYSKAGRFLNWLSGGKLSKSLEKSIEKDKKLRDEARSNLIFNHKDVIDSDVERKLMDEAIKRKAKVINVKPNPTRMNEIIKTKEVDDKLYDSLRPIHGDKKVRQLKDTNKNFDYQIIHPVNSGTDKLAKDVGEIDNATPGIGINRKLKNIINKQSKKKKHVDEFFDSIKDLDETSGILKGVSRFVKGSPVVKNELNSSKTGLKLLKESGMKKDDLEIAKKNLKDSDDFYKHGSKVFYKTPLLNSMKKKSKKK